MRSFRQTHADHGAWEYEPATGKMRWSNSLYDIHGVTRGCIRPECRARRLEVERAELIAVKKAIRASGLALASRLQPAARQPHGSHPLLDRVLGSDHVGDYASPARGASGAFTQTA